MFEIHLMKFSKGERVIILTTESKPAGYATIMNYNQQLNKYKLSFKYPHSAEAEEIELPEERILTDNNPVFSVS